MQVSALAGGEQAMNRVQRRQMKRKDRRWAYATRLTPFWLCYELALCGLMLAAVAVYYTYTVSVVNSDVFQSR
jgi:hypothetical protein